MTQDEVAFFLLFGGLYLIVSLVLCSPILFWGRRRARWDWLDLVILIVPFCFWAALILSPLSAGRKSMANMGEGNIIALTLPAAALRVGLGAGRFKFLYQLACLGVWTFVAALLFFLTPSLPE